MVGFLNLISHGNALLQLQHTQRFTYCGVIYSILRMFADANLFLSYKRAEP